MSVREWCDLNSGSIIDDVNLCTTNEQLGCWIRASRFGY